MRNTPQKLHRFAAGTALILVLIFGISAQAQTTTPALTGFLPQGDYLLVVDGADDPRGEVFFSQAARAYLVVTSAVDSPILMWPRTGNLEKVNLMKFDKQPNGAINLLEGAGMGVVGKFSATQATIQFEVDGHQIELKSKPHLLGFQSTEDLKNYSADYARTADAYSPSQPILGQLRAQGEDVKVQVFFGSWCPACKRMVPRILKVAEELGESTVDIQFYGLPQGEAFSKDPEIQGKNITGVPTAIVYKNGQEVGRISGNDWKVPELAIKNLIG